VDNAAIRRIGHVQEDLIVWHFHTPCSRLPPPSLSLSLSLSPSLSHTHSLSLTHSRHSLARDILRILLH
jgi:hypothetical protein